MKLNQFTGLDGLFEIALRQYGQRSAESGRVVLVCRGGRLFGADPSGRIYTGELQTNDADAPAQDCREELLDRCHRRRDMTIRISGEIDPSARSQSTTVLVAGKPVDVDITYLGPLPP